MPNMSLNDAILLASLGYSCVDLLCEWEMFNSCSRPIHQWLLVSYACVISFRTVHLLCQSASFQRGNASSNNVGEFLLDLRHKSALSRVLASFTWLLALPFFIVWTMIGTFWMWDVMKTSPQCMPTDTHLFFSGLWLVVSYVWILIHVSLGVVAWILERRVRQAEGDLLQIADAETLSRWGQVGQLSGYRDLEGPSGLTPSEIMALPSATLTAADIKAMTLTGCTECSICIQELSAGDGVRCLSSCGHRFHRTCIDLWLLRSVDCPLCKRSVRGSVEAI